MWLWRDVREEIGWLPKVFIGRQTTICGTHIFNVGLGQPLFGDASLKSALHSEADISDVISEPLIYAALFVRKWDLADSISVERLGPNDCNCRGFRMPALRCRRYTQAAGVGKSAGEEPAGHHGDGGGADLLAARAG